MAEFTLCNLCSKPGTLADSHDIARIPCHVSCFRSEVFTVWRCNNCQSLHSKEEVDLPYFYEDYPFKRHRLDFHTRIGYRNRVRMLKGAGVKETDRILDYGCGAGLFVDFLRSQGFSNVFGYDFFVPTFADRGALEQSYDVVVSHDVIEHVDSPREFLAEMIRLVTPGGTLVIGTPNAQKLKLQYREFPAVELSQPYHRHILSEPALLALAVGAGLKVKHLYRRFYFDSLVPSVNTRFMWTYVHHLGGMIDVCVEPLKLGAILTSPKLIFFALFGFFFPPRGNMLLTFEVPQKSAQTEKSEQRRVNQ